MGATAASTEQPVSQDSCISCLPHAHRPMELAVLMFGNECTWNAM